MMLLWMLTLMERRGAVWDNLAHSFGKWGDTCVCRVSWELEAGAVNIWHRVAASDIIFNNLFSLLQHLPQCRLITYLIICFPYSLSQGWDLGLACHFLSLMPNWVRDTRCSRNACCLNEWINICKAHEYTDVHIYNIYIYGVSTAPRLELPSKVFITGKQTAPRTVGRGKTSPLLYCLIEVFIL